MMPRGPRPRGRALRKTYHSRSLYMMVKKTCRNRLTAFTNTDSKNNQASPDIMIAVCDWEEGYQRVKGEFPSSACARCSRVVSVVVAGGELWSGELLPVGDRYAFFASRVRRNSWV